MAKSAAARQLEQDPALPQNKRARRRLVGAAALAIAAGIILTLVLDSEPRTPVKEVEVNIPARGSPGVGQTPTDAAMPAADAGMGHAAASPAAAIEGRVKSPEPGREPTSSASPAGTIESPLPGEPAANPAPAHESARSEPAAPMPAQAVPAPAPLRHSGSPSKKRSPDTASASAAGASGKADPKAGKADAKAGKAGAHADAKKDAKAVSEPASSAVRPAARYSVQVGAFSTPQSAQQQLERVRKAGLPAYTETILTGQGKRIRVRAGPFKSHDEAERASAKLKLSGIESAIIKP